ncbi:spherulation-specific family 4 protein [Saccharothrix coeruleofusca]|uniref:spherulation-specific family 4 protein n=1 Tax=Saccharothrix coeruleofusca TaxID=33919 RepID=UPI001670DCEE|nr:spherulation-specific family 4 protein [Saccharothrix coeruleofusca]
MTRLRTAVGRAGVVVTTVAALAPAPASAAPPHQKTAVPAYWSPTTPDGLTGFRRLAQNRPTTGIVVVNGSRSMPEAPFSRAWADAIEAMHNAGIKVLVYVDTGYLGVEFGQGAHRTRDGETSPEAWTAQIERDIDDWYALYGGYGVDGVFLDQTIATCGAEGEHVARYAAISARIRSTHPHAHIALNPGHPTEQCYEGVADTILSFEGDYQSYLAHTPPEWELAHADHDKFWHLVYDVPTREDMAAVVARSKANGAGYVYVTDRGHDPYPWDVIAGYWDAELGEVAGVVDTTAPAAPREATAVASPVQVVLRWRGSLDNVAVTDYEVLRDGVPVGTTHDTAFTATGLQPGTAYTFSVRARDVAGNASTPSAPVTVTTPPASVLAPAGCVTPTAAQYRADFTRDFTHRRVFIDSDDDPATGWALPPGQPQGMDHMVEGSVLYRYTGPGWAWEPVAEVEQEVAGPTFTWRVSTDVLAEAVGSRQVVVFNGSDGAEDFSDPVVVVATDDCSAEAFPSAPRHARGGR